MRKVLAIAVGKLLAFAGGLMGRGSATPGAVALRICPDLSEHLVLPGVKVAVTGSSGKGSTSALIADALKDLGFKVVHNVSGSNMLNGIISLLVRSSTIGGRIKGDALVFEVDERSCKHVFPFIRPQIVVVTNITRDQPPRQAHTDFIFDEIKKSLSGEERLVINGDNPLLMRFGLVEGPAGRTMDLSRITTYGLADPDGFGSGESRFEAVDAAYCPICASRLEYGFYLIESIGDFRCPRGHFGRRLDVAATGFVKGEALDGGEDAILVDELLRVAANARLLYNVMNVLAAYTALCEMPLGLDREGIASALSRQTVSKKLFTSYGWQGRQVFVLNNKAENAATFNQSMLFAANLPGPITLVVGWKEISRRYDTDDLSWLHDIAFELLAEKTTAAICTGVDATGIAVRLKYAGIEEALIEAFEDMDERVSEALAGTTGSIVAILNFDHVEPFNQLMGQGDGK